MGITQIIHALLRVSAETCLTLVFSTPTPYVFCRKAQPFCFRNAEKKYFFYHTQAQPFPWRSTFLHVLRKSLLLRQAYYFFKPSARNASSLLSFFYHLIKKNFHGAIGISNKDL
jgi:hypothetical protein